MCDRILEMDPAKPTHSQKYLPPTTESLFTIDRDSTFPSDQSSTQKRSKNIINDVSKCKYGNDSVNSVIDNLIDSHICNDDSTIDHSKRRDDNFKAMDNVSSINRNSKMQISRTGRVSNVMPKGAPTNSNTFNFGQLLNLKHNRDSLRSKSSDFCDDGFRKNDGLASSSAVSTSPNHVKVKLRSMWNNMKYGWRIKREVNLKLDSAIWILGQCYHNKPDGDSILNQNVIDKLKLDVFSKIWFTYRVDFPVIPGTDFVSDTGWGCMLRCGQMMMAQAFVSHFLHRDWRLNSNQSFHKQMIHKKILRWFGDSLSENSPFSLHHLVALGEIYGRKAGDWYGPTHAAQALRDALIAAKRDYPELCDVCMHVALDGIVFKQDVFDLCFNCVNKEATELTCDHKKIDQISLESEAFGSFIAIDEQMEHPETVLFENADNSNSMCSFIEDESRATSYIDACPSYSEFGPPSFNTAQQTWKSLILFVSIRLGNDKINSFYIPCLKSLLAYQHCIGIIGGRPKHALYFIGWQDDKLIHMDPHACQPAIEVDKEEFCHKSFHSSSIRTMSFTEMDPSCAIGFYFKQRAEFDLFLEKFSEITAPMKKNLDYPVFALAEGRRADTEDVDSYTYAQSSSSRSKTRKNSDDDYILL